MSKNEQSLGTYKTVWTSDSLTRHVCQADFEANRSELNFGLAHTHPYLQRAKYHRADGKTLYSTFFCKATDTQNSFMKMECQVLKEAKEIVHTHPV